jgi:hypothetical protein
MDGKKVMHIRFRNIEIKDSSLFIPIRLEAFPKMFNLKELKKGYFPFQFNSPCRYDYVGPYPSPDQYGIDFMTPAKRTDFMAWYDTVKHETFNFKENFIAYCVSDVELLCQGALEFRRVNILSSKRSEDDPGCCPFRERITLAGYCNMLYTRNYMPENSIGMLPPSGFNPASNMSRECELWLKFIATSENIHIEHAKNGGEKIVHPYAVDGFCESNKTLYEFLGCHFHGKFV